MVCWDDSTGEQYYNESGYSGTGEGRNNPAAQHKVDVGPIPQGGWWWGSPYYSPRTGQNTIRLTPLTNNQCFNTKRNRDSFRVHGDNKKKDASKGCLILPPNRTLIPPGEILYVVE